jgi:spore germination protein KC
MNPYLNPVASRIVLTEKEDKKVPVLEGAAAFGKHEFAGWLNDKETRGFLWIENKIGGSVRVINCPFDNKPVTLEIKNAKTKIKSEIINGIPNYTIKVKASAKITEKVCNTEFNEPEKLHRLQDTMAESIRGDVQSAVDAAKRLDTDILDLSGSLHRQHKKEWKSLSSDWPEVFRKSKVKIEVTATIPDVSLLAKSLTPVEQAPAWNFQKEGQE